MGVILNLEIPHAIDNLFFISNVVRCYLPFFNSIWPNMLNSFSSTSLLYSSLSISMVVFPPSIYGGIICLTGLQSHSLLL